MKKSPMGKSRRSATGDLQGEALKLWGDLTSRFQFDPGQLAVLRSGLRALQTAEDCREAIHSTGLVTVDRFGQAKANPLLASEAQSRALWLRTAISLGLTLPGDDRPDDLAEGHEGRIDE